MFRNRVVIDLEEEAERAYEEEYQRVVNLAQNDNVDELPLPAQQQSRGRRRINTLRNAPLDSTHRSVPAYRVNGVRYRVGDCIELIQPIGQYEAQFVEIRQIWVGPAFQEVLLRGIPYARTRNVDNRFVLPQRNEVCQILDVDKNDKRLDEQQAMVEIRPSAVLTTRRLCKTNTDFKAARNCRFGNDASWPKPGRRAETEDTAPLTCRWKMRNEYMDATHRACGRTFGGALIHLSETDIDDPLYRTSDRERQREWLRRDETSPWARGLGRYRCADAFCGGGGASEGARLAGLEVVVAIDNDPDACRTYRRNFPRVNLREQCISHFITNDHGEPDIDILHMSPSCQPHSPAHTHIGKNDEQNEAVLYACGDLVDKLRPRAFTLEQTFGLVHSKSIHHFNALLKGFTDLSYSVLWRERVELVDYGLPQVRKRLLMIGCCPGAKLPSWPAPTHGFGRKPYVTEYQAISRIPPNAPLHNVAGARRVNEPARDPHRPFPRTITCAGAEKVFHHSGKRVHTPCELLVLQGFRHTYKIEGGKGKQLRQIGNAVPPVVIKEFFRAIIQELERQDREWAPAAVVMRPSVPHRAGPAQRRAFALPGTFTTFSHVPNAAPHSTLNRRAQHSHHVPGYSRLNGDVDEDEALQIAMCESRRRRERRPWHQVITVSDDETDLPECMDRLSVAPTEPASGGSSMLPRDTAAMLRPTQEYQARRPLQAPANLSSPATVSQLSPPTTGESTIPQTIAGSWSQATANWSFVSTPSRPAPKTPSSAASSVTLDHSRSSSPCPQTKRKSDAKAGGETETESARKRARAAAICEDQDDQDDVEVVFEMRPSSFADRLAASSRRRIRQTSAISAGYGSSRLHEEASLPPRGEDTRSLAFGQRLGKLPVTRATSTDWQF